MKLWAITLKDIIRSFRSAFFVIFAFVVPVMTTAIFYFAFGGVSSDSSGFELSQTRVLVVNLDQPSAQYGGFSAGKMLVDFMRSEEMASLVTITEAADAATARAAVDRQEAGVALIIPAGFTEAAVGAANQAGIELYKDPKLTIGPGIVEGIVRQFVDGFAGSRIAAQTLAAQLAGHGLTVNATAVQQVAMQYASWAEEVGKAQQGQTFPLLTVRQPSGQEAKTDDRTSIVGLIMSGMMAFYAFYTGSASAMNILQEEEDGTLPRLFTTTTSQATIMGGKFLAILSNLVIQMAALLAFSALVFKVNWGPPLSILMVSLGTIVASAGMGLLLNSLLKNTRQAGIIFGGVLTVAGMVGMLSVFTGSVPGSSQSVGTVSLVVPQGWAVRGFGQLLQGATPGQVLPTMAVLLAVGIVFFGLGVLRFRRRYA